MMTKFIEQDVLKLKIQKTNEEITKLNERILKNTGDVFLESLALERVQKQEELIVLTRFLEERYDSLEDKKHHTTLESYQSYMLQLNMEWMIHDIGSARTLIELKKVQGKKAALDCVVGGYFGIDSMVVIKQDGEA